MTDQDLNTPSRCPICQGAGCVQAGFYSGCIGTSLSPEQCRTCGGNGLVWCGRTAGDMPTNDQDNEWHVRELFITAHDIKDTIQRLTRELAHEREKVRVLREALDHCMEVSADPCKYGRILTVSDRQIIRDALAATEPKEKP